MPVTKSDVAERDSEHQPEPQPLIIPVLPNDEVDPILPEPIKAPSESDDQPSPDSINENPKEPKIIAAAYV